MGWLLQCRPGSPRASNVERYSLMRRLTVKESRLLHCRPGSPRACNAERYSLMRRLTVTAAMQAGIAQGQQCGALLPHAAADGDGAGCGLPGAVL